MVTRRSRAPNAQGASSLAGGSAPDWTLPARAPPAADSPRPADTLRGRPPPQPAAPHPGAPLPLQTRHPYATTGLGGGSAVSAGGRTPVGTALHVLQPPPAPLQQQQPPYPYQAQPQPQPWQPYPYQPPPPPPGLAYSGGGGGYWVAAAGGPGGELWPRGAEGEGTAWPQEGTEWLQVKESQGGGGGGGGGSGGGGGWWTEDGEWVRPFARLRCSFYCLEPSGGWALDYRVGGP